MQSDTKSNNPNLQPYQQANNSCMKSIGDTAARLKAEYMAAHNRTPWLKHELEWVSRLHMRRKGKLGEQFVEDWLKKEGFNVAKASGTSADRLVDNMRAEIKLSMLSQKGTYTFNQLRKQDYAFAVCLGMSLFETHCYVVPKAEIIDHWDDMRRQHVSGEETRMFTMSPNDPPAWLRPYGGSPEEAIRILSELTLAN